ncbi:MAG: site-specific integrase, partial [Acidobacteria bacterium]|nr:site-specific integrase [Acidobacteriota bacterium]
YFVKTKSAKARAVPMTLRLREALRNLPISHSEAARDWVFTRYGKHMRCIRTAFANAVKRAGLGPDVTFHTLRHTFASWYVMAGGDIYRLKDYLGHSEIKMTMRYAHLSPSYRKQGVVHMGLDGRNGARSEHLSNIPEPVESQSVI